MKDPKPMFPVMPGYKWLIDHGLVSFDEFGPLQPWHYLRPGEELDVTAHWNKLYQGDRLIAFARRQDCDDLACFRIADGRAQSVCMIHAWTADGYEVTAEHTTFWDWLKAVVDDIAEWAALPEE